MWGCIWLISILVAGWLLVVAVQAFAWGLWSDARRYAPAGDVDRTCLTWAILCWILSVALGLIMGLLTYQMITGGALDLSWVLDILCGLPEPTRVQ